MTTLTATLLGSVSPKPVQLVIAGLSVGAAWSLARTDVDGVVRAVSSGVSDGSQVIRTDSRTPLNAACTWTVWVNGSVVATATATVSAGSRWLLQSLDGHTQVAFAWRPGVPRAYDIVSASIPVRGRARPPRFSAPGGDGGGSLSIRTSPANTALLESLLSAGKPLVLRTDGSVRDLPAVDILGIDRASTDTWDAIDLADPTRLSSDRVWALEYTLLDDPEPSTILTAFTWDDVDAKALTWATVDVMAMTWDQAEAFDWSTL